MNNMLKRWIVLSILMGLLFPHSVFAADRADKIDGKSQSSSNKIQNFPDEESWRNQVESSRNMGNNLFVLGGISAAGALGLFIAGYQDVRDAENVEGCYRSGSTIYCKDEASRKESEEKVDDSRGKIIGGSALLSAATGLIVWGVFKKIKASRLFRRGAAKGYSLSMQWNKVDEVSVALAYKF